jgi:hypothetical protein
MTSERMIASNRSNGRRSRGPRTVAGKDSSRRNAFRHGLAVRVLTDPAMCAKVEKLARIIAGADADEVRLHYARIIAEAQCDLDRVQDAKVALLNSCLGEMTSPNTAQSDFAPDLESTDRDCETDDLSGSECSQDLALISTVLRQLCRLNRYEDKAISRRRRAIRALATLQPP